MSGGIVVRVKGGGCGVGEGIENVVDDDTEDDEYCDPNDGPDDIEDDEYCDTMDDPDDTDDGEDGCSESIVTNVKWVSNDVGVSVDWPLILVNRVCGKNTFRTEDAGMNSTICEFMMLIVDLGVERLC